LQEIRAGKQKILRKQIKIRCVASLLQHRFLHNDFLPDYKTGCIPDIETALQTNGLKSQIPITAGKRSVAYGKNTCKSWVIYNQRPANTNKILMSLGDIPGIRLA
jgi:hypothetical protein